MNPLVEHLKKNPSLFVGVIALILVGGFGLLRANQITKLSQLEANLKMELDTIHSNVKHSKGIESDTRQLKNLVDSMEDRLFVSEEQSTNINFFYSLEDELNITISEVSQLGQTNRRYSEKGPDELKIYSVVSYNITLNGTFREILRFVYEIYQMDFIMRITDVEIETGYKSGNKADPLEAKIRIVVLAKK